MAPSYNIHHLKTNNYGTNSGRLFPYGVCFYELLEQRGKHCHALFIELPNEDENEITIKEELKKIK